MAWVVSYVMLTIATPTINTTARMTKFSPAEIIRLSISTPAYITQGTFINFHAVIIRIYMVSPIRYYKRDPMGKRRGSGYYYKRSYKGTKKWYSKYNMFGDEKIRARHKGKGGRYRHAGDKNKRTHI
ncbi:MAG: hypothetical protein ACPL6C_00620 [bacterium]